MTSRTGRGPRPRVGFVLALLLLASVGGVSAGCQQILGIHERTNPIHVECSGESCGCEAGFGDCDAKLANGCETDLSVSAESCGACGNQCQNGQCQEGSCACSANYADCDADPKNGCEGSLLDDPHSCGACGHDCLGGECVGGACQAVQIASDPVNSIQVGIVRSGDFLYFADRDFDQTNISTLQRVPIAGGAPELFATLGNVEVDDLAADDQSVYVMTEAGIVRYDIATKAMTPLISDTFDFDGELGLTTSDVYYVKEDADRITEHLRRVPKAGGADVLVTDDIVDTSLGEVMTTFDSQPYWISNEGISTVDSSGAPVVFSTAIDNEVFTFTRDETSLYFQSMGDMMERQVLADMTSTMADSGVDSLGGVSSLAALDGSLFWMTTTSLYGWTGTTSRVLVTGLEPAFRVALVVTDQAVYFYETHGIFLVAR